MDHKKSFFVQQLHIFNLPLILILKLFGHVYIFKYKGICQRFLKSNFLPSIGDFKDVDHWRSSRAAAFNILKSSFSFREEVQFTKKIGDLQLKTGVIFLQIFFKDFEQYIFLLDLANSNCTRPVIIGNSFLRYLQRHHRELLQEHSTLTFPFSFADSLYTFLESQALVAKTLVKMFYMKGENFNFRPFKYIFTGISPVEYPTSEKSLNFAWPVTNHVTKASDTLFILDLEPEQLSRDYLLNQKINLVTRLMLLRSLPFSKKISILANTLRQIFTCGPAYSRQFHFNCNLQNRLWLEILNIVKPSFFCFSFSSGWPEPYEITVANSLAIRTINWFYGTSEFGYTKHIANFQDDSIRFCIRAAKEVWVWNPLIKELIEKRSFIPSESQIEVVGPVLNGNWNLVSAPPTRTELFKIAIFDITPMRSRMRLQYGEGPYCNAEMQDRIYQTVIKIHDHFKNVQLLIKTKRANNPMIFDEQPALNQLLHSRLDRVQFLSPSSDPYLAIQEADLVISTPYTSPSILALILGRNGIFYDPTGIAKHTFREAFANLTVYSEKELIAYISKAMNQTDDVRAPPYRVHFPVITPTQIAKTLRTRLHSDIQPS